MHRFWSCLAAIAVALFAGGCGVPHPEVRVYQPLTSLQKPTAIDPSPTNFAGLRILLRCIPGEIGPGDSQRFCTRLSTFFSNQGAQVDVAVPRAAGFGGAPDLVNGARPDMVIELTSRMLHLENPPFMWVVCIGSCGIIPAFSDYSYAQDISIRDGEGFELASDTLQARFVTYHGTGIWAVNKALDIFVRKRSERITGDTAQKDFSKDFYRQINQLAFNARIRSSVLRSFEQSAAPAKPATSPKPNP